MRTDLGKLQRSVGDLNKRMTQISSQNIETSRRYHEVVAAMNSRLQVGTTPGNPLLVKQWNEAQHKLEAIVESLCLLYTSPSPRDGLLSRMPSSA